MEQLKHPEEGINPLESLRENIEEGTRALESFREGMGDKTQQLQESLGDRAENAIGNMIENSRLEAPELSLDSGCPETEVPQMEPCVWYRIPVEGGCTADGSEYHIYARRGNSEKLCVFFSGGGIAWNPYTAARPVTGGRVLAWQPNYYWSNLRPFTQIYNIGVGLTDNSRKNPFYDWNFVVITYATGDMHLGRNEYHFKDDQGQEQCIHFHGFENFCLSMQISRRLFPSAGKLLIAGESAGAFAVPALAEKVHQDYYPQCRDVTLLSDSALLLNRNWKKTAREVWNVPEEICRDIHGRNLTLDWYRALYKRHGSEWRYLYANSVRDYLLSAFYNDVKNRRYDTDDRIQRIFQRQLRDMTSSLKEITPDFGIYLCDWKRPFLYRGGTVHTMVRQPEFYLHRRTRPSMAAWLAAAVEGDVRDEGLELTRKRTRKQRIEIREKRKKALKEAGRRAKKTRLADRADMETKQT